MATPFDPDTTFKASNVINESERSASRSSDAGKIVQLETTGQFHPGFIPNITRGGDGSDGALDTSSGAVDIDCGGERFVIKQYTSINVVTNNVTFSNKHDNGTIVIFKCQGDATISATIDLSGLGANGGAGVSNGGGVQTFGEDGLPGTSVWLLEEGGGGGGGSGINNTTSTSTDSAVAPTKISGFYTVNEYQVQAGIIAVACGSGGGGGGGALADSGTQTSGAAGGPGGGSFIMHVGGALDFTGTIDVSGGDGSDAADALGGSQNAAAGGGGGGGAAGMAVVVAGSITTNTGTVNAAGGAGGAGGDASVTSGTVSGDDNPGRGGAGAASIFSDGGDGGGDGTGGGAPSGQGAGGGGGSGGNCRGSGSSDSGGTGGAGGASSGGVVIAL